MLMPRRDAGGTPGPTDPERLVRAGGATLAVLVLWAGLAALRPEVTYHLAPALVVWATPWVLGATRLRLSSAATGAGLIAALGGAALLRAAGWLAGPVLFGADAFVEAVVVSVGAALVASVASFSLVRRSDGQTGPPA